MFSMWGDCILHTTHHVLSAECLDAIGDWTKMHLRSNVSGSVIEAYKIAYEKATTNALIKEVAAMEVSGS